MNNFTINFKRSRTIESSHKIKLLISDINGKKILSSGNDLDYIYPRSSIKIFQAIPFVKSNAIKYFKMNSKEIALACSSHRGETYHIKNLQNWINKVGLGKNKLKCGIHNPLNMEASEKLFRLNHKTDQLYNNCAGKHLAMITSCIINKYKINNYLEFTHPHQKKIRDILEKFSNSKIKRSSFGVDGCSAPQYSFRIKDISKMLCNLIKSYKKKFEYSDEVIKLMNSVFQNPNYIGGTDSLDSIIMSISNKKIFCKGGAEGVFLFIDISKEIVGVLKVVDGNERVLPFTVYKLFKKLKIMNNNELEKLKKNYSFKIMNHAKINVGKIEVNL